MQPTPKIDQVMHSRLPIGKDEKILAIYRHHWFAYVGPLLVGLITMGLIIGLATFLVVSQGAATSSLAMHKGQIMLGAVLLALLVGLFTYIPVWLRSQEQVVLTEEALLQILQPSLFANKISQLNLQHVADVSVRQDFFGSMLGYGKISVETPGEQDNYEFYMVPNAQLASKQIIEAHENFQAALESGRLSTTLGAPQQQAPVVDPVQYQQFLQYQQMVAQQQASQQTAQAPVQPSENNQPPVQPTQSSDGTGQSQPTPAQPDNTWPQPPAVPEDPTAQRPQ